MHWCCCLPEHVQCLFNNSLVTCYGVHPFLLPVLMWLTYVSCQFWRCLWLHLVWYGSDMLGLSGWALTLLYSTTWYCVPPGKVKKIGVPSIVCLECYTTFSFTMKTYRLLPLHTKDFFKLVGQKIFISVSAFCWYSQRPERTPLKGWVLCSAIHHTTVAHSQYFSHSLMVELAKPLFLWIACVWHIGGGGGRGKLYFLGKTISISCYRCSW